MVKKFLIFNKNVGNNSEFTFKWDQNKKNELDGAPLEIFQTERLFQSFKFLTIPLPIYSMTDRRRNCFVFTCSHIDNNTQFVFPFAFVPIKQIHT